MQSCLPNPTTAEHAQSKRLLQHLRQLIAAHGPLSFAQYMKYCLYAPTLGYYSSGKTKFGATGDFFTAPELGALFARCVVHAVQPALSQLGADASFLELGGGSGAFAEAALKQFAAAGSMPSHYWMLEPSADLRERQREHLSTTLPAELNARVAWLDQPPKQNWRGVLFANEVIDALPATRFAMHGDKVYEEHVALDCNGDLMRIDCPAETLVSNAVRHIECYLGADLPFGYRSEVLPQLPCWIQTVASSLKTGLMLFVDYGYVRREFYLPERCDGTLLAHYRHRVHHNLLHFPGLNDLTASVDFSALAEAGNSAGFSVVAYLPQAQFLLASGLAQVFESARAETANETARYQLTQQVKRLTLPEHMGERFQAMLLARDMGAQTLSPPLLAANQSFRL